MELAFQTEEETLDDEAILRYDGRLPSGFANSKKREDVVPALPLEGNLHRF